MNRKWIYFTILCALILLTGWTVSGTNSFPAGGKKYSSAQLSEKYNYTDQIIVKYRNPTFVRSAHKAGLNANVMINDRLSSLNASAGLTLQHKRFMSGSGHVLKLPRRMTLDEAKEIVHKLKSNPHVLYAQPDKKIFPLAVPNDPEYVNQWHYKSYGAPDNEPGGVNLPLAWDITTGLVSVVVAVVDSGLVTHADLTRRVPGYDFISISDVAGDGTGRDADPSDEGDGCTAVEQNNSGSPCYNTSCAPGCVDDEPSSWHGTHVAGTIGANSNNATGVAGINWVSPILPVRVLGKGGGTDSDAIDGLRWAAGLSVPGVDPNPNPAKVINLSLGGFGSCADDPAWQAAIEEVVAAGATVVVAAGNWPIDVSYFTPASCNGVIAVAATNRAGGRATYSAYGSLIKIAAPGGETDPTLENGVLSTLNSGTQDPVASPGGDTYNYYDGTSMAAPHVSGIASLMLSVNPGLTPGVLLALMQSTAHTPPASCTGCGAGIIDAAAAVTAANNAASLSTDLALAEVTSSPTTSPMLVGETFSHTISVTNNGLDSAVATVVTYVQSGTATIGNISATPSAGTCTGSGNLLTCNLGTLAAAGTVNITFTATPYTTGSIVHTATASSAVPDPTPANNSWTYSITAENPVPIISGISPSNATAGGAAFTLTVNGSGFSGESVVQWNGKARATTFVSFSQLRADIPATDITSAGNRVVTVVNPMPGGGTSNEATFTVNAPPSPGGGGSSGNMCFIATAAFGSPMEKHVRILRDFRDRYLLKNGTGKAFVELYYKMSPPLASIIAQNSALRLLTRAGLMPIIGAAYLSLYLGVWSTLLLMIAFIITITAIFWITRRKLMLLKARG
ncbi:MAG TPA: S8 family serine peptidase [Smithellaceae bacterium]|nr:S8 family serine peptidase [Smithellaceae bacterium]HRS89039.1 S8 family serine peptidase [Smithellaceae bacterium]HRV25089.1 S8 family serine peptidase [Smithellaceae bacterium]